MAELYRCQIATGLLKRRFWIYVWEVEIGTGGVLHYVGMTGDTSTYNPQSPFKRATDHLGFNDNSNPLRRYLNEKGHALESCSALGLVAYGPLYDVPSDPKAYRATRGKVAALERELSGALRAANYEVVHADPGCRFEYEPAKFSELLAAFAKHFPKLSKRA